MKWLTLSTKYGYMLWELFKKEEEEEEKTEGYGGLMC